MKRESGLHRFSVLLAVCTLVLVAAGASVVSKQAGLSVPDWPLSYGQVMPEMKDGVFYEHGHRMIATAVGFLTVVLCVWLWRSDDRKWMKWLGSGALLAVIAQGVLGGLTVLFLLPKAVSIGHACTAQLFFSLTLALTAFTARSWREPVEPLKDQGWPSMRSLAWVTPLSVLVQVGLGAAYRHKALGVMSHVGWAFITALIVMVTASFAWSQYGQIRPMKRTAQWLIGITSLQLLLGLLALMARIQNADPLQPQTGMVILTVIHTAVGALVLGLSVLLSVYILRYVQAEAVAPAGSTGQRLASPGRAG